MRCFVCGSEYDDDSDTIPPVYDTEYEEALCLYCWEDAYLLRILRNNDPVAFVKNRASE